MLRNIDNAEFSSVILSATCIDVGTAPLTRTLSKFTISTPTSKSTSAQQLANTIRTDLQSTDPSIVGVEGGGKSRFKTTAAQSAPTRERKKC